LEVNKIKKNIETSFEKLLETEISEILNICTALKLKGIKEKKPIKD
jgi:hypothetical protein